MHTVRRSRARAARRRAKGGGTLHAAIGGGHGVDANQGEIIDALLSAGADVQVLAAVGGGCPDLLVGYGGHNFLLEVKDGAKERARRALNDRQRDWHATWTHGRRPVVVESPAQSLIAIGAIRIA